MNGYWGALSPEGTAPEQQYDRWYPFSVQVKNEWRYASKLSHVLRNEKETIFFIDLSGVLLKIQYTNQSEKKYYFFFKLAIPLCYF